jgi:hypothetical protein
MTKNNEFKRNCGGCVFSRFAERLMSVWNTEENSFSGLRLDELKPQNLSILDDENSLKNRKLRTNNWVQMKAAWDRNDPSLQRSWIHFLNF